MAQAKNYHYYGAEAQRVYDEYVYIGRQAKLIDGNHVIVYALPQRKEKPKDKGKPVRKDEEKTTQAPQESRRGNGFSRYKNADE